MSFCIEKIFRIFVKGDKIMEKKFSKRLAGVLSCGLLAAAAFTFGEYVCVSKTEPLSARAETTQGTEVPDGTKNAVVLDYADNKDGTLTVTISVEGEVCFAGFAGVLQYDAAVLGYSSSQALYTGIVLNAETEGAFAFSFAAVQNVTTAVDMFNVTFTYSGDVNTSLSLKIEEGNFSDAAFEDVEYTVFGGKIVIAEDDGGDSTSADSKSDGSGTVGAPDSSSTAGCGASLRESAFSAGIFLLVACGTVVYAKKRKN